jgi:pleckstrin homology domain containing family A member 8
VDCSRMDIAIPGEQHMYLKAPSPSDRQRWLVALGSCKASLNTAGPRRNSGTFYSNFSIHPNEKTL